MTKVRVLVGHEKGRVRPDVGRQAQEVGGQRPALRRLGDLPPQGLAGRSEPALRLAVQRLVRPDDPALRRRRQDLGAGRQQVRLRRRARHPPVVRRHAAPVGVQARLAPRAVADRPGHGLRRRRGRRAVPHRPTAAQTWQELPGLREHGTGTHWQPGAGGMCLHTIMLDPEQSRPHLRRHLGGRRVPHRRRRRDLEADQPRPALATSIPDPDAEVGHCVHRIAHAPVAPGRALHAEALGRDAQRRRRRQLARGQRQPADRLRLPDRRPRARAGDDLRRADQERLRALSRPTASCASTAAGPAATSGRR